jgi:hypothetical protein
LAALETVSLRALLGREAELPAISFDALSLSREDAGFVACFVAGVAAGFVAVVAAVFFAGVAADFVAGLAAVFFAGVADFELLVSDVAGCESALPAREDAADDGRETALPAREDAGDDRGGSRLPAREDAADDGLSWRSRGRCSFGTTSGRFVVAFNAGSRLPARDDTGDDSADDCFDSGRPGRPSRGFRFDTTLFSASLNLSLGLGTGLPSATLSTLLSRDKDCAGEDFALLSRDKDCAGVDSALLSCNRGRAFLIGLGLSFEASSTSRDLFFPGTGGCAWDSPSDSCSVDDKGCVDPTLSCDDSCDSPVVGFLLGGVSFVARTLTSRTTFFAAFLKDPPRLAGLAAGSVFVGVSRGCGVGCDAGRFNFKILVTVFAACFKVPAWPAGLAAGPLADGIVCAGGGGE